MQTNPIQQPDQTPRLLYNPDVVAHEFDYDKMGPNPQHFVVPALSGIRVPAHMAETFAGRLADILVNKRGIKTNYQADKEKLLQEILP